MMTAYYQITLDDYILDMYASDLKDFSSADISNAFSTLRKDPKVSRFPMPAKIISVLSPKTTDLDNSNEVAQRIFGAVKKFGWSNREDAKTYIGDLGWKVVDMTGGWGQLCETLNDRMIPTLTAQYRDLAKGLMTKARAGQLDRPPEIPKEISIYGNKNLKLMKSIDGELDE